MLVVENEGNGNWNGVRMEDLGKERGRDGIKQSMDGVKKGIKEGDKRDRRSLSLHGPHTPGTSRSCQISASHQGFLTKRAAYKLFKTKSSISCYFFEERYIFL